MAFLEVNNIKKSFGKNEILKGISFDLQKGERFPHYLNFPVNKSLFNNKCYR